jgi:Glycosyltransferase sugar-binding region containing DXD motif
MIPKVVHYCFGMSSDFGGKPWSLIHHVCLKSAVERIKPTDVHFYCEFEPAGPWWELSRRMVTVERIKAPREIFGNPLHHAAHRADVIRLEKLLACGGIYLDADVFVHGSFDDLLSHGTVLGEQRVSGDIIGLCNAVILAEAHAPFIERWYSEYRSFRSMGRDKYWDEHSVRVPLQLSKQLPDCITVLPHYAFFWPTYKPEDLALIFKSAAPIDISRAHATHLWETPAWDQYLEHLTPGRVRELDTNFHYWARSMVGALPDNYGLPPFVARLGRGVRALKRHLRTATNKSITGIMSR